MSQDLVMHIGRIVVLLLATQLSSMAVEIEVKSAQYSTYVARGDHNGFPPSSRTNFSFVPISDFYTNSDEYSTVESEADAALFMIFSLAAAAQHQGLPGFAEASVEAQFTFAPVSDVLAQIHLEFFAKGQYFYGGNDVSLFDVTADALMWSYYDQGFGGGNIPWIYDSTRGGIVASLTLPTQLLMTHDYNFKMSSRGASIFPDWNLRLTQMSGLEVPEPTAFSLFVLAGGLLMALRRRQKNLARE